MRCLPFASICRIAPVVALCAASIPSTASSPDRAESLEKAFSTPLTLAKAIRIGLANQQTIRIADSQLRSARARVVEAAAGYLPTVTPSYTYTNRKAITAPVGGSTVSEGTVAEIAAHQLIFDTGKRENTLDQARHSERAAGFSMLDERQGVVLNVTSAFYALLRNKELVRVAEASAANANTTLEATKAYVTAGTSRLIDTFQAEADYKNALVQVSRARNNVRLALISLRNAMGVPTPVQIVTDDTPPAAPSADPDPTPVQTYVAKALAARLDLKRAGETVQAQRKGLNVARIESSLQVEADVSARYQIEPEHGNDRAFTTTFTYPLFDAGVTAARVREARASVDQSREQQEQVRQAVVLDVETAYYLREEARGRIGATQAALTAARKNFEAVRASQREGTSDIVAVIQAQTQLVTSETNAVQALYDYHTADAQLVRAIGANDTTRTESAKP